MHTIPTYPTRRFVRTRANSKAVSVRLTKEEVKALKLQARAMLADWPDFLRARLMTPELTINHAATAHGENTPCRKKGGAR